MGKRIQTISRFDEKDKLKIERLITITGLTTRQCADRYGVSTERIRMILKEVKLWREGLLPSL